MCYSVFYICDILAIGPKCSDPDGPVGGTKSCSSFGGNNFCTVTCSSGSQLYKATAAFWNCDNTGNWTPSDRIPDCVGKRNHITVFAILLWGVVT